VHGTISRYAGNQCLGGACPTAQGDGGPALAAQLSEPYGLLWDGSGLVIADLNGTLRRVGAGGTIGRVAGAGSCAAPPACGDGGAALSATFFFLADVTGDGDGGFVVADLFLGSVRHVHLVAPPGLQIGLVAYRVTPAAPRHGRPLRLEVLLGHAARLTLAVRSGLRTITIGSVAGRVGANTLVWNGKLAGRPAKAGRYTLIVTASAEGATATTSLPVRLR
jgi:hypothetical protein